MQTLMGYSWPFKNAVLLAHAIYTCCQASAFSKPPLTSCWLPARFGWVTPATNDSLKPPRSITSRILLTRLRTPPLTNVVTVWGQRENLKPGMHKGLINSSSSSHQLPSRRHGGNGEPPLASSQQQKHPRSLRRDHPGTLGASGTDSVTTCLKLN